MAATISSLFSAFNKEIIVTESTLSTVDYRWIRIRNILNQFYYGYDKSGTGLFVGSIGRKTDIHTSDVDVVYMLPDSKYTQFNGYISNGQQALLQEFRGAILATYPQTVIKADGLVVVVAFSDGIRFEIMPAFKQTNFSFIFPVSNSGGSWRTTNPLAEIVAMNDVHTVTNRNAKKLARMVRAWKEYNSVSMGGLQIDTYVERFIKNYEHGGKSYTYYDWMTRDFFKFLSNQNDAAAYILALGSNQQVYQYGKFCQKANRAYELAIQADVSFTKGYQQAAVSYWKEIYGTKFKYAE